MQEKPRILFVDDEVDFAETMSTLLISKGYDVEIAFTGEEALSLINAKNYHLMVADINMPKMDGIELIRKVKKIHPNLRTIVFTGFPSKDIQAEALELRVNNLLIKPFSTERFLEIINKTLKKNGDDDRMGLIGPVELACQDLIQMYSMDARTLILEIRHLDDMGRIYFEKGRVVNAETRDFVGRKAFMEIFGWKSGGFQTKPLGSNVEQTINESVEQLLLEGMSLPEEGAEEGEVRSRGASGEEVEKFIEEKERIKKKTKEESMATLDEILAEFRGDVAEFVSTDIVEIASGLSIGGGSIFPDFDGTVASAAYADVVKANDRAIYALGGKEALGVTEDILITTEKAYILIVVYPGNKFYHGLAITRKGNLGMARVTMKKYMSRIAEVIPR